MPRSTVPITNFTSGMFDDKLDGRLDIEQYSSGAKEITNAIVEWYGGVTRVPGTYYITTVKDSTKNTRLVPFIFSDEQAYILEFSENSIRIIHDHGIIQSGATDYVITTTYSDTEIFELDFAQTADVMYIAHKSHPLAALIRTTDTSWTLADVTFVWGPWLDMNTTTTTMDSSVTTGTGTLTASASYFEAGHVNAYFKLHSGYVRIDSLTSATVANITVIDDLTAHTATTDWYEGAFSTLRGFPACVTFYEDRLVLVATTYQPTTVWLSEPGIYERFEGGSDDGDSITHTISARQLNIFKWVHSGDFLSLGNYGGVVKYWSGSQSDPITPSNKNAKQILEEGVNGTKPITINTRPYYVDRSGRIVRSLVYSLTDDAYNGADVTLLSRGLVDGEIIQMAYQQAPHSIVWMITSAGTLLSATINIQQKITAFTQHTDTGLYKSVCCIPADGYDEVYFVVERVVNGSTYRYLEYMKKYDETTQTDLFYVRSGLTYNSTATTTITGLDHLEGETVSVFADGYVRPDETVSSGQITLDTEASKVHVGLGYTTVIETLDLNAGSAVGTAISKYRNIGNVSVKLHNTMGCNIGRTGHMDIVPFAKPAVLYSGIKTIMFPEGWKKDKTVRITQSYPLPLTVNGIYPDMDTND